MLTKFLTIIAAIFVVFSITAKAQVGSTPGQTDSDKVQVVSPEKQALIRELLDVTDSKKNSEAILNTIFDQMQKDMPEMVWASLSEIEGIKELSQAEQQRLRDEMNESARRSSQRFREALIQRLNFAQLIEDISIPLYAKYFDDNELRDLIAFYKSPTGKHTMAVMSNLFADSMAKAQERMMPVIKDVMSEISADERARFREKIASLVESHHKTSTPRNKNRHRRPGM
jgi:hypothetical protein